jgi:carbamoyltransferase
MRIVGLYNWHDGGYCVLEDGKIVEHVEIERYTRIKESGGDSLQYFIDHFLNKRSLSLDDVDYWVSPYPDFNLSKEYNTFDIIPKEKISFFPHHFCHAAHAYHSSNFDNAYIVTLDSAGMDENDRSVSTCSYIAQKNQIVKTGDILNDYFSLGNLWGRVTRFIFKLSAGYPRGHQAGSVMAMAALGDHTKYYNDFMTMATTAFQAVKVMPPGYKRGVYVPPEEDVIHPYLDKYRKIAEESEQEKFNMAASLQKVTEELIFNVTRSAILEANKLGFESKNICFAGGVSLNSVAMAKVLKEMKYNIENCFIPPVPYDGGLTIGACQHFWYHVLDNPKTGDFVSPYLGEEYSKEDIENSILERSGELHVRRDFSIDSCVDLLVDNKIVSVFQGKSESGRRALGNRSILANPANPEMKELINKKVKHRQWYRPFAPTVLEEHGDEWFEDFFPSPYMGFVFKFKDDSLGKVPAVEHVDKTARIQTVNLDQNKNYYELIKIFYEKTGISMILNTSFNDREPICETPGHAIDCFLRTDIDYLYFYEYRILVEKSSESLSK